MFKILIVEDNITFRHTLKDLLLVRFPNMSIAEAKDEKEALEKMELFCPDLVFMDIQLPGRNGLGILRKHKDIFNESSIIIFTNHDSPEYKQKAIQEGADHFLSKYYSSPQDIFHLVESIASEQGKV